MKITLYTITDCEFSKQEKEYLTAHQLQFEEKNLETNKEFLTEMLAVSNNFAGTPVTKIEKDDGQIVILKGFTKDEFDKALGLAPQEKAVPPPPPVEPVTKPADAQPAIPQQQAPANDLSAEASAKADPLNSILNDLQAKSGTPSTPTDSLNPTDATPSAPTVPDFPAKT